MKYGLGSSHHLPMSPWGQWPMSSEPPCMKEEPVPVGEGSKHRKVGGLTLMLGR